MNDYTYIVQQYFHKRVEIFLSTYAKKVFGINHYYVRFEFAKSRGQIHAHLLAILGDKSHLYDFNTLLHKNRMKSEEVQAQILDTWMKKIFKLTAIHPASTTKGVPILSKIVVPEGYLEKKPDEHPSAKYLSEVVDV